MKKSSSSVPNAVSDGDVVVGSVDARIFGKVSRLGSVCCCIEGSSIRLEGSRRVVSDGVVLHKAGGEGIWTSLDVSFLRECCKVFVTLTRLGVEAWEGRPARLVALYSQLRPRLWQRVQAGFCLVHLTFAAAQALQLSRSLGAPGATDDALIAVTDAAFRVRLRFPEAFPDPVRPAVLGAVGALGCMRNPGEWAAAIPELNEALRAANVTKFDLDLS